MLSDANHPETDNRDSEQPTRQVTTAGGLFKGESAALFIIILLAGGLVVSLLGNFFLVLSNRGLAQRDSIYVQTPEGTTAAAQEFDQSYRTDESLKQTVTSWIQLTFEWDDSLGGNVEFRGERIPTAAYAASYLMSDGFRTEFLRQYGADVVPSSALSGELTSIVRFLNVSDPRQVGEGVWEIDVVCNRIDLLRGVEQREVPFNRTYRLVAVPPVESPIDTENPFVEEIRELTRNGVLITDITPLDLN